MFHPGMQPVCFATYALDEVMARSAAICKRFPLLLSLTLATWLRANSETLHTHFEEAHADSDAALAIHASGSLGHASAVNRRMMRAETPQPASMMEIEKHHLHQDAYQLYQDLQAQAQLPSQTFEQQVTVPGPLVQQVQREESSLSAQAQSARELGSKLRPFDSLQAEQPQELPVETDADDDVTEKPQLPGVRSHDEPSNSSAESTESLDCQWYDWSPWSFCTKTCGTGVNHRKRTVAVQETNGGHPCKGEDEEFGRCNEIDCPVDCVWGDWTSWSDCSASCGGGVRQREAPILVQGNQVGHPCNLDDGVQMNNCNEKHCSHDCEWSEWSVWGSCSVSCAGGRKKRQRSIKQPAIEQGKKCEGNTEDEAECAVKSCPIDCTMSDWNPWEPCTASCGNGVRVRKRSTDLLAEGGGADCPGPFQEEVPCSEADCPLACVWGDWGPWSACSASCGANDAHASSVRQRAVMQQGGGAPCQGDDKRRKTCGANACPIDCTWGAWSEWNTCTKTCGGGITERFRNTSISASSGGSECQGATRDVMSCSQTLCPVNCKLSDWTPWTDCSTHCGNGTSLRYRSEEVPPARGGQPCHDSLQDEQTCIARDCIPSEVLLRSGAASQVTGVMQIVTEDPVGFAANPLAEIVCREAVTEFAVLPVKRVHVSLQPATTHTMHPSRSVNAWFSMLVPNSTNNSAVREEISDRDTISAGRVLRNLLHRAGLWLFTNVTKLLVSRPKIRMPKSTPPPVSLPPKQTGNTTRVLCFMKMIVPQAVQFAENKHSVAAVQQTVAEMAGVSNRSVHVSMMPDLVLKANVDARGDIDQDKAELQKAMAEGPRADLDAWFTLLAPDADNVAEADQNAKNVGRALQAEIPATVTARLKENLIAENLPVWSSNSEVTRIQCKAEVTEKQDDVHLDQRVTGELKLSVPAPRHFSQDHRAEEGVRKAIAEIAEVPQERVRVSLMPSKATLYDESLLVELGEDPADVASVKDDEVSAWYVILLPSHPEDGAEKLKAKMNNLDFTLAELKLQDLLMDAGLTQSVRIVAASAQSEPSNQSQQLEPEHIKQAAAEGLSKEKFEQAIASGAEHSAVTMGSDAATPPYVVSSPGGDAAELAVAVANSSEARVKNVVNDEVDSLVQHVKSAAFGQSVSLAVSLLMTLGAMLNR